MISLRYVPHQQAVSLIHRVFMVQCPSCLESVPFFLEMIVMMRYLDEYHNGIIRVAGDQSYHQ